jgi:hypothetical protein
MEMINHTIATGVLEKYEIIRIARDAFQAMKNNFEGDPVTTAEQDIIDFMEHEKNPSKGKEFTSTAHNNLPNGGGSIDGAKITRDLISKVTGFDVRNLDLSVWKAGDDAARKANMIAETKGGTVNGIQVSGCATKAPAAQPTLATSPPGTCQDDPATTDYSEAHLQLPPEGTVLESAIKDFKHNDCAQAQKIKTCTPEETAKTGCPGAGKRVAEELYRCGDYYVSTWCNAFTDPKKDEIQFNITYACRGWSQQGNGIPGSGTTDSFSRYLPARIGYYGGLASKDGTTLMQKKRFWNMLMNEIKSNKTAFPYGYKDAAGFLQAASEGIFGLSWGAISVIVRLQSWRSKRHSLVTSCFLHYTPMMRQVHSPASSTWVSAATSLAPQ